MLNLANLGGQGGPIPAQPWGAMPGGFGGFGGGPVASPAPVAPSTAFPPGGNLAGAPAPTLSSPVPMPGAPVANPMPVGAPASWQASGFGGPTGTAMPAQNWAGSGGFGGQGMPGGMGGMGGNFVPLRSLGAFQGMPNF